MYLYTVTGAVGEEGYLDLAKSGDLTGKNVYVNMTNKCPCSCVFCLRQTKQQQEGNTLWLKEGEPSVETMLELFAQYDLNVINELVFCGFGEPLERLEDVCRVIDSLKETYPNLKVRLNTIGLANLIYGRDVTPDVENDDDCQRNQCQEPVRRSIINGGTSKAEANADDNRTCDNRRQVAHHAFDADHADDQGKNQVQKTCYHNTSAGIGCLVVDTHAGIFSGIQVCNSGETA